MDPTEEATGIFVGEREVHNPARDRGRVNRFMTGTVATLATPIGNAVGDALRDFAMGLGDLISREATSADEDLCEFTSALGDLYKQLTRANSREDTLWSIHQVMQTLDSLLAGGDTATIISRMQAMFVIDGELLRGGPKPRAVSDRAITETIGQLDIFRTRLEIYRRVLEGKSHTSRAKLTALRYELAKRLIANTPTGDIPPIEKKRYDLLTQAEVDKLDIEERQQIEKALAEELHVEDTIPVSPPTGRIGVLDFFREIKIERQGRWVNGIESLANTMVRATASTASELFFKTTGIRTRGCISADDIDLPPIEDVEAHIEDHRPGGDNLTVDTVIQRKNLMHRPLSIGRLAEIFTNFVVEGEKKGMYEIWGKALCIYFEHLKKTMEEERATHPIPATNTRAQKHFETTLGDVNKSITLLRRTLSVKEPSVEAFRNTFQTISRLMNDHPLIVLHGLGELDLGGILEDLAVDEREGEATATTKTTMSKIRKGIQGAQREEESTIKTPQEEQAIFHRHLEEAASLGHLYSLYNSVLALLRGDQSRRIQFHELYNSILKTDSKGRPLSDERRRELFEQKLRVQLVDAAGDVWIFTRWLIKLIAIPLLSWGIDLGINLFIENSKKSIAEFIEGMNPSVEGEVGMKTLDRVAAAAQSVVEVIDQRTLRSKRDGHPDIYKRGLLTEEMIDAGNGDASPSDVYATFTRAAIDRFGPQVVKCVEAINRFESKLSDGIEEFDSTVVRTILSVASLAVRIPLFAIRIVVMPIQYATNWVVLTGMKKFLVWIGVVEKGMKATISSLEKDPSKRTVITPIIDRSVLELLDTLWQALHTDEGGEIIDTDDIDFTKFVASPERKEKQKLALSSVFKLGQAAQDMRTDKDQAVPPPVVGTLVDYLKDQARTIGLGASSDISVAAFNTLTQPKMVYHMLSTALDAVNSSMKASGTDFDTEEDTDLREQIHEKVQQLIALSIHRASEVLKAKDPTENVNINRHVRGVQELFLDVPRLELPALEDEEAEAEADESAMGPVVEKRAPGSSAGGSEHEEYRDMITHWENCITSFVEHPDSKECFQALIDVRDELLNVWRILQQEIIVLEQDPTTARVALNIHKRHLDGVIEHLLKFQDQYLKIFDVAVRKKYTESHPLVMDKLGRAGHLCAQITCRLRVSKKLIESDTVGGSIGEFRNEHLDAISEHIAEAKAIFAELKAQDHRRKEEATQTDDLRKLVLSAENNLFFLRELHTRMEAHKRTTTLAKRLLGEPLCEQRVIQEPSLTQSIRYKYGTQITLYFNASVRDELHEAFPEYRRVGTKDHEVVTKIKTAFRTLAGLNNVPEQKDARQANIKAIQDILRKTTKEREEYVLEYIEQGAKVSDGRHKVAKREAIASRTATTHTARDLKGVIALPKGEALDSLRELRKATAALEEVKPIEFNPLPDLTTVPFMRHMLQTANRELEEKVLSIYSEVASNQDIATFLALRLLFVPFNRATAS